ncbi:MAG: ABC transporter substrate-binding protein [Gammaproteobacteria bacterium]|nr:MAG: ABC transporter substrate-binding protein [Gammaproteobacteria bacterium]
MLLKTGFHPLPIIFLLIITLFSSSVHAAASMAMGYEPKYAENFSHFDYVNPNARKGGKLVLSGFGTFDSLNPYILKGISADGLGLVYESLVEKSLDEPFSAYGLLAEDMELAADKLSVTFRLNPRARFSDGSEVMAEDVKVSFDTLMSEQAHPQFRFYYADVKQAVVLDQRTVRFDFKRVNPELHLIVGSIPVFSSRWLEGKSFDKITEEKPISSGPYVIESFDLGKQIVYTRNPDYWAKDLPVRKGMYNFDRVVYKYYKDTTVALEAFKAGEFDFFFENHSKRWARDHTGPRYASGEIQKTELKHQNNAGMQGFVFNMRRPLFQDIRVRKALTLGLDFEWSNSFLFYDQYVRNNSYFSNSELAAQGLPEGDELKLLVPYRDQLSADVFETIWQPPTTAPPSSLRQNLKQAKQLLEQAGWRVQDGVLKNARGEVFEFEVMLIQKGFERIFAPYAHNLKKLGIELNYRTVDASLYERRIRTYDFDMAVTSYPQSASPGNELRNMFHSSSADQQGSRNLAGIKHPVVDALVEKIISAETRADLITACRALDRVLLHQEYLVPNWYINVHRIAYWDKFNIPQTLPLYYDPETWLLQSWSHKK